jgi:two-component sensor histidine kinase
MPRPGTQVFEGLPAYTVKPRSAGAWALACLLPLLAITIRWLIGYFNPLISPYHFLLIATLIVSLMAGSMAGFAAAIIGALISWFAFHTDVQFQFSVSAIIVYGLASVIVIGISDQYRHLLRKSQDQYAESERQLALVRAENHILSRIAEDVEVREALELICRAAEAYSGNSILASVLLLDADGQHLRQGAAPSLPADYNARVDGLRIGPAAGSCGTAAYRKEPVYVTDIATDPIWADYRDLALDHGLRACWSVPIISKSHGLMGTFAVYHREKGSPADDERETINLLMRIAMLAIEHDRNMRFKELLVDELIHRVKNIFAVVQALASNSLRDRCDEDAYEAFEARLRAMADTQTLLTQSNWSSVYFRDLAEKIVVAPFASMKKCIRLNGPNIKVPADFTLSLALSLHELSTNAAKYGALAADKGQVDIQWGLSPSGERQPEFFLVWSESGGPITKPPTRTGFGTRMIKSSFPAGKVQLDFRSEGLKCEIRVPFTVTNSTPGAQVRP